MVSLCNRGPALLQRMAHVDADYLGTFLFDRLLHMQASSTVTVMSDENARTNIVPELWNPHVTIDGRRKESRRMADITGSGMILPRPCLIGETSSHHPIPTPSHAGDSKGGWPDYVIEAALQRLFPYPLPRDVRSAP